MLIPALLLLPFAFVVSAIAVLRKGNRKAAGIGVLCFVAAMATGAWAILQSRSSTAGIGFVFLPLTASGAGLLGLGFWSFRNSTSPPARILAWLFAALAAAAIAMPIVGGVQTTRLNAARDRDYAAAEKAIAENRNTIATMLAQSRGAESAAIDAAIRSRMNDRTFLIPALENKFVSPDLLDEIANTTKDRSILQALANNPSLSRAARSRVEAMLSSP
jgi:hypothetical protein